MRRPAAFTLIEVLLTLALLALVASVMITGTSQFFRLREKRPDELLWQAVAAAREHALATEQTVSLRYDTDAHQLALAWPGGSDQAALDGATIRFLPAEDTGHKLLGGILTANHDIPLVHFYPDGTCDAFRVELTLPSGKTDILQVDPWTCAPILPAAP